MRLSNRPNDLSSASAELAVSPGAKVTLVFKLCQLDFTQTGRLILFFNFRLVESTLEAPRRPGNLTDLCQACRRRPLSLRCAE